MNQNSGSFGGSSYIFKFLNWLNMVFAEYSSLFLIYFVQLNIWIFVSKLTNKRFSHSLDPDAKVIIKRDDFTIVIWYDYYLDISFCCLFIIFNRVNSSAVFLSSEKSPLVLPTSLLSLSNDIHVSSSFVLSKTILV